MSGYRERLQRINALAGRPGRAVYDYIEFRYSRGTTGNELRRINSLRECVGTNYGREFICPGALAVKLESVKAGEFPEMSRQCEERPAVLEMLLWLQWRSFQPGYIDGVVDEALNRAGDRMGFEALHATRPARNGKFSESQIATLLEAAPWMYAMGSSTGGDIGEDEFADNTLVNGLEYRRLRRLKPSDEAMFRKSSYEQPEAWVEFCRERARAQLAGYLHALCLSPAIDFSGRQFPWIADVIGLLLETCQAHAEHVTATTPKTEALEMIWREADFARQAKGLVVVVGDTRTGKTFSFNGKVRARPGCFRFVDTPEKTDMGRYYEAWATSLGGEHWSDTLPAQGVRDLVCYIYKVTGLTALVDEAQYVAPIDGTVRKTTAAHRMEWTRRSLLDKGVSMVFSVTPQSQKQWEKFMRITEYPENQYVGRILNRRILPACVRLEDLRTIVSHLLQGAERDAIDFVIAVAKSNPMPLRVVHALIIRARAFYTADDDTAPSYEAIESAWEDLKSHLTAVKHSPQQIAEINAEKERAAAGVETAVASLPRHGRTPAAQPQTPTISRGNRTAKAEPEPRGSLVPDLAEA